MEETTINYAGTETGSLLHSSEFSCCNYFNLCSKNGHCVNLFELMQPKCYYRKNLEKGCRYYGDKYQLGIEDMSKIKSVTRQANSITFKFTVGKNKDGQFVHLFYMLFNGKEVFLGSKISKKLIKPDQLVSLAKEGLKQPYEHDNQAD